MYGGDKHVPPENSLRPNGHVEAVYADTVDLDDPMPMKSTKRSGLKPR